jgi:hypothetical protein
MPASTLASALFASAHLPEPRAFASKPFDLDLDFNGPDRSALMTAVIASCCADDEPSSSARENSAWNLPVSARIARLLRIVRLTMESENLTVAQPCPHADCRQPFELALSFESLLANSGESVAADVVRFPLEDSASIALRLPTGRDQAAWQSQHYKDPTAALTAIMRSLVVEPRNATDLSPEHIAPIAAAMEAADPLVAFTVCTMCPHCQRNSELPIDLEAVGLQELAQFRHSVLADVHLLAKHYGWTEAEVLAIPPRRRANYKKLIAAAERTFP